jgi:hypothetical protein
MNEQEVEDWLSLKWCEQLAEGELSHPWVSPGNCSVIDMGIQNHIKGEATRIFKISFVLRFS